MWMHSSSEKSMCSPCPVSRARRTAARAATAAKVPPTHSPMRPPAWKGSPPRRPRVAIEPPSACSVNSVAAHSESGPPRPNGVIDRTTSPGKRVEKVRRSLSATAKLSTSRSAAATRCSTAGSSGSPTIARFEWWRKRNSAPSSPPRSAPVADQRRSGSPAGASTFTTSAPASAKSLVAYAPAMPVERSTTRSSPSPCIAPPGPMATVASFGGSRVSNALRLAAAARCERGQHRETRRRTELGRGFGRRLEGPDVHVTPLDAGIAVEVGRQVRRHRGVVARVDGGRSRLQVVVARADVERIVKDRPGPGQDHRDVGLVPEEEIVAIRDDADRTDLETLVVAGDDVVRDRADGVSARGAVRGDPDAAGRYRVVHDLDRQLAT